MVAQAGAVAVALAGRYASSMVPPEPDGAPDLSLPLGPSDEAWRALSPRGREAFLVGAIDALQEEVMLAPEGQQHATARSRPTRSAHPCRDRASLP